MDAPNQTTLTARTKGDSGIVAYRLLSAIVAMVVSLRGDDGALRLEALSDRTI